MSAFEFFFSFYGLVLGLSVAVIATGLATAIQHRKKIQIGWLTPLLAIFVALGVASFWSNAWTTLQHLPVSYGLLVAGLGIALTYFIAASLVFPHHAVHEALIERQSKMAVVFLTGMGGAPDAVNALHRGAADYLCKPFRRAALLLALERAERRMADMDHDRVRRERRERLARLTPRELEVLGGIGEGKLSKRIAHELGISPRTVEMHRANICEKLQTNTAGALLLAAGAGLIEAAA